MLPEAVAVALVATAVEVAVAVALVATAVEVAVAVVSQPPPNTCSM